MNPATVFAFLKALLPTKKIATWILGIISAAIALFLGLNNADLKAQFCASEVVTLPALPVVAAPVISVPATVPAAAAQALKK